MIAPPLVLLFVRVRSQQVESYDVLIRQQRSLFYGVGISGLILLLILMAVGDGPAVLRASLLAALATNLLAGTINHFVTKISVHAGAMAGCTAVLVAIAPWPVWAVSGLLTLALGWARVQLGRHTVGQVLLGWGVAGGCVAVVFWLLF